MKSKRKTLLLIDGLLNLLLGILLLSFPLGIGAVLGVPLPQSAFYPTILGGVLFGIGIALLLECHGTLHGFSGLGIFGAIAVNFCGAAVLVVWLIWGGLNLPLRGLIILWLIALSVFGIGTCEVMSKGSRKN